MTKEYIKQKINENNDKIEHLMKLNSFVLNKEIRDLIEENRKLQEECPHSFKNGKCEFCYLEEK